ncbi:DUF4373 domain-containing protein [Thermoanaerobacter sp. A7A]|uniref:DUF4373 domain-containing protein n=1 Tax=Thermoanaerobacter sp. A7A TaxID=1350366 RepID=UPI00041DAF0D|nr:DUF4373 domain-containing protein [Thermoanaerobacter sp. A7A]
MARPQKEGLDYFPLDVDMDQDDKIALIEARYGLIGFGVVIRLFMKIYKNSYFYEWTEKEQLLFARRVNVDINVINEIINDCLKWGIFDKSIYEKHKVLTSRGIQRRYLKAADRRQRVQISSAYLLLDDEEVNAFKNLVIVNNNPHSSGNNADINPQSKEKNSKKESKEEKTVITSTDADSGPEQKDIRSGESLTVEEVKMAGMAAGKETCEQPSKTLVERRFDEFWAAYPKKVGKKAAWAAWKKVKPDAELFDKIMTAISKAKATEQWQRENGRFIPNPTTWLNQGRWDDEYEEGPINGVNSKHFDGYNQQPAVSPPGNEGKRDALAGFKRAEVLDLYSRSIKGK